MNTRRQKASAHRMGGDVKAVLGLTFCLTALGLMIGDTTLGVIVTLIVFLLLCYAMFRVPLRHSVFALVFLALTLENPADGPVYGFKTPWAMVGAIMTNHLNTVERSLGFTSWMAFSGIEISLYVLLGIAFYRRRLGSTVDTAGQVATPRPLVRLAYVSLLGTLGIWIGGILRGGDFGMSLWQVNSVVYLPIVFLVCHLALRGPQDHGTLAKVVLAGSAYRALLAIYIYKMVAPPGWPPDVPPPHPVYATAHADSITFAVGCVIVLAALLERVNGRKGWQVALLLPLYALGIHANNRRIAFVHIAAVFLTVYIVTRENPVKRKVNRFLVRASPLIAAYAVVGWNAASSIFKPVRVLRSVIDAQSDSSSFWRELENFNLIQTLRLHPILGAGYGNQYDEIVAMPAVDYSLEKYLPHNSILGLWAFCGPIGYTTLTLLWAAGVYFSMRAYHAAKLPNHRAAGLACYGAVLIYLIQCWGDLGLATWCGIFTVGPAVALGGKLAVVTGAWNPRAAPYRAGGFMGWLLK
jgi:hypothetical protein